MSMTEHDHPPDFEGFTDLSADPDAPEPDLPPLALDTVLDDAHRERFRIEVDDVASWALRKLARLRMDQHRDDTTAALEHERIAAWRDDQAAHRAHDVEFFTAHLVDYARRQRALGRKSVPLPPGTLKTRENAERIQVSDAEAFVTWARSGAALDLVRERPVPDMTAIAKALTIAGDAVVDESGVIVPGLSVAPASVSVTVVTE